MKKRLLSLALALVLCLALTVPASAAVITEIVSADDVDRYLDGYIYPIQGFNEDITWHGNPFDGYGAFTVTGKEIIPPQTYVQITNFSDGVAWGERGNVWYVVDTSGRELFALEGTQNDWGKPGDFHDGLARLYQKETQKYGYVDKTGKIVIPFEHNNRAGDFHDGLAVYYDSANAYFGYMDKTGTVVIPAIYSNASDFVHGFAKVSTGKRWTVIDTTGKELIPENASASGLALGNWPEDITETVVRVKLADGYAFINHAGQVVSGGYSDAGTFVDGMAMVLKDGMYGFVNEAGVLAIPCTLRSVTPFRDGYAVNTIDGDANRDIIDKTGKVVGSNLYNAWFSYIGNGCIRIASKDSGRIRYGLLDCTGKEIVPFKYKAIEDFSGGVAAVQNFDNKWGFVDTTGTEIVPCTLEDVDYENCPGIFSVKGYNGDGRWSIVSASGWTAPSTPSTPAAPANVGGFTDVTTGDYFADPVLWAVENKITTGTSATTFSPNQNCTVEQIITFLWRANGSPKPAGSNPFSDVKSGEYYTDAAVWAYEMGMVSGTTFGVGAPCTRSMAVTYMWKAAGSPSAPAAAFTDVAAGADYAPAVAWAVEQNVTTGTSATTFDPNGVCTRGQIVTFLYRALAK